MVELLVVIALVGLLVSLLLPAVQAARESARRSGCANKMRQLALAVANFESGNGQFPSAAVMTNASVGTGAYNAPAASYSGPPWSVMILPYQEDQARFDKFNLQGTFGGAFNEDDGAANAAEQKKRHPDYICPSSLHSPLISGVAGVNGPYAGTSYFPVVGGGSTTGISNCVQPGPTSPTNAPPCIGFGYRFMAASGVMFMNSKTRTAHISDGTTKSLLLGESRYGQLASGYNWSSGTKGVEYTWASAVYARTFGNPFFVSGVVAANTLNADCNPMTANCEQTYSHSYFGSFHRGGALFAMADGAVVWFDDSTSAAVLRNLGNVCDGAGTLP